MNTLTSMCVCLCVDPYQVSERELEDIVKMGYSAAAAGQQGGATSNLIGDYR
jgi:hypothetical protein